MAAHRWKPPVVMEHHTTRYAVRAARPRLVRVRCTYSAPPRRGKLPCAFGTCRTQEAGTRSPYAQYGGPGTYVSLTREAASSPGARPRACYAGPVSDPP